MNKISESKPAKLCYEHLGGKLGALLLEQFLIKGWLKKTVSGGKDFQITEKGALEFMKLGVDLSLIKS